MATIARIGGARICIYGNDHNPPHIHVHYAECDVQIVLSTLEVRPDTLPRGLAREIVHWARENRALLQRRWAKLNEVRR